MLVWREMTLEEAQISDTHLSIECRNKFKQRFSHQMLFTNRSRKSNNPTLTLGSNVMVSGLNGNFHPNLTSDKIIFDLNWFN